MNSESVTTVKPSFLSLTATLVDEVKSAKSHAAIDRKLGLMRGMPPPPSTTRAFLDFMLPFSLYGDRTA